MFRESLQDQSRKLERQPVADVGPPGTDAVPLPGIFSLQEDLNVLRTVPLSDRTSSLAQRQEQLPEQREGRHRLRFRLGFGHLNPDVRRLTGRPQCVARQAQRLGAVRL